MQDKFEDQLPELPTEILLHIMTFLGPRDLTTLELVCKDWKNLASSDIVWKTATGHTKEELANPDLYTILTLPTKTKFSFTALPKRYALVEEELQEFFQHTDYIKQLSFPEGIGNDFIRTDRLPAVYEPKYKNRIFTCEKELMDVFNQARKDSTEYTCYGHNEFFVRYKEVNGEIHIHALKHITQHTEWTSFQAPFVFDRKLVANFPSVKPASANTQDKTAKPAQKTADRASGKSHAETTPTGHRRPATKERKPQPSLAAPLYQPEFFQPPEPVTTTTTPSRGPLHLTHQQVKDHSKGCTIS